MNANFDRSIFVRNLTGLAAAVVLGTTLIGAATGPALTTSPIATPMMTAAAQSNIVARA